MPLFARFSVNVTLNLTHGRRAKAKVVEQCSVMVSAPGLCS